MYCLGGIQKRYTKADSGVFPEHPSTWGSYVQKCLGCLQRHRGEDKCTGDLNALECKWLQNHSIRKMRDSIEEKKRVRILFLKSQIT
jgi:hypothetical protein